MLDSPAAVLNRFPEQRVLVVGDAMLDSYLSGPSRRLCQEAPVPIVDVSARFDSPGGAANCALNLRRMGAQVDLIGVTGQDCEGEQLRELLVDAGVATRLLIPADDRRTISKTRILCDNHLVVRFDQGSTNLLDEESERAVLARLPEAFERADVVILSDYGYGVLTPRVVAALATLQARSPRILAVDSKRLGQYRSLGMTLCKPNYSETLELLGRKPSAATADRRWEKLPEDQENILKLTGSRIVAVTMDRDGAMVLERGQTPLRTLVNSAPQRHTAGAGDTYLSTFALALAAGGTTAVGAELASTAASVVVSKEFTSTCSLFELHDRLAGEACPRYDDPDVLSALAEHRRQRRRIVLTNGCFDILHRGHITYLEQARRLGDVLIVGVNSDESIRRLKGHGRPINSLADRMRVLSALSCVDHVVCFGEDTPHRLIEAVRPDVFVKGGDYTRETLPEADLVERLGGVIKILSFTADRSTTGIISKICHAYGGAKESARHAFSGGDHAAEVAVRAASAVRSA